MLKIFTDGGARGNPGPAGAGVVVLDEDVVIYKGSRYLGVKTNNQAEYLALIMALTWVDENKKIVAQKGILFFLDSQLIVRQLNGRYKIKSDNIKTLAMLAKSLIKKIDNKIKFIFVPREKNKLADSLANKAMDEHIGDK
jgi:ribonuclease HI